MLSKLIETAEAATIGLKTILPSLGSTEEQQSMQATLPSETVSPVSVTVSQICSPGLHSAALRGCKLFNKSVAPGKLLTVQ